MPKKKEPGAAASRSKKRTGKGPRDDADDDDGGALEGGEEDDVAAYIAAITRIMETVETDCLLAGGPDVGCGSATMTAFMDTAASLPGAAGSTRASPGPSVGDTFSTHLRQIREEMIKAYIRRVREGVMRAERSMRTAWYPGPRVIAR